MEFIPKTDHHIIKKRFYKAIECNEPNTLAYLLMKGENPNKEQDDNFSPLSRAVFLGNVEIVKTF